jgi:hypothetical protein
MDFLSEYLKIEIDGKDMPAFLAEVEKYNAIMTQLPLTPEERDLMEQKFKEHVQQKYGKK